MRIALAAFLTFLCPGLMAATQVEVCFNYGCQARATVEFTEAQIDAAAAGLAGSRSAEEERQHIAEAVGRLYRLAGAQAPIAADRAGNFADQGVNGKMDCIDHSTTTTHLLEVLQARGLLQFHRVVPKARRTSLVLFQHFSAVVEEVEGVAASVETVSVPVPDHVPVLMALCDCPAPVAAAAPLATMPQAAPGARFVIDSWFVEQGEPAVVLPLGDWLDGDGPYVP